MCGFRFLPLVFLSALAGLSSSDRDPAWTSLDKAYKALQIRDFDSAVDHFQEAVRLQPERASIRKDLAYTLLKTGETEFARDEFAEAMRLDPADEHVALEYAFLAYETKRQAEARRIFDRLRQKGNAIAEQAFQNIDRPLAEGIARWRDAVELAPHSFSAHEELARLAEQRDLLDLAARHYRRAWELRPGRRMFLLDLGRVWQKAGQEEPAFAALLAASRGSESRTAEEARELLPRRYPWVYEFRAALELDPGNTALRRELAWLLLEMGQKAEAEREFDDLVRSAPDDAWSTAQLGFLLLARGEASQAIPLLERALEADDDELTDRVRDALRLPRTFRRRPDVPRTTRSAEAMELARRSLEAGYLKDAIKYLRLAHENDPLDFNVILKLGETYNNLREDREAIEWYRLARRSPDAAQAAEASRAFRNLSPQFARVRTSAWMYPFYSSRWHDTFTYAQFRSELMPRWPVRPYVSLRFAGDLRRTATNPGTGAPVLLSENAFIPGIGAATSGWRGIRAWAEAGVAASYIESADQKRFTPDLRGGINWSRTSGRNFGATRSGLFTEHTADVVFMSRFGNDTLLYSLNRTGWTLLPSSPAQLQVTWNLNLTADTRRLQWANAIETGPGIRLRLSSLPSPIILTLDTLDGRHTVLDGTRPPRFKDFRLGLWYAFTR